MPHRRRGRAGDGGLGGGCRAGLADGLGAGRVRAPLGTGVFAGRARAGQASYGIVVMDDNGWMMVATTPEPERPGIDQAAATSERAFQNSFAGATAAAEAHHRAGNEASARYYRQLRKQLIDGQPE
ncbi:hypothetical protein [Sphingomonas hankookensis]|uniref:hypothetical protein n=1 Tax=Sphingomonas hankookensis TaxID=563996 RepID=UPI00234EC6E1|nr:hypothetical protein [Sphingomonas hankookensis]WCP73979.1 hypothetical protein PPZ50_18095 [Sphingomonas hankookensis]